MSEQELDRQPLHSYTEAVDWINNLIPFGIKPGLLRMEMLMERLNHPERRLKVIHVAGTNGKGSTCAYLSRVLRQCGYDVGTFTSPYIEKFTNRIQYNLENIADETLLQLANQIKPLVDEIAETELGSPTTFEVCTALSLLYYATVAYPDYVVFETGLGGRLDSTNVVLPVVTVITNVGHDHMDVLGDTLELIAYEKAGIIKACVPVVCAVEQPGPLAVLKETAAARRSSLYVLGEHYNTRTISSTEQEQHFDFTGIFRELKDVVISLSGPHQIKNAAVALMTLEVLRQYNALVVEDDELYRGMRDAAWPGRMEQLSASPRLIVDGAHNPEGAEALALTLSQHYTYKKLNFMIGILSTKNHTGYLRHILPIADTIIVTEPDFRKKKDSYELAELVNELIRESGRAVEVIVEPQWKRALDRLMALTGEDELAVVSGTLYLISDVRSWILYHSDSEKGW